MRKAMPLSQIQEKFCKEYLFDHNAGRAALRAGYPPSYARRNIYKMLKRVTVKTRIEELQKELCEKYDVTNESVIRELALIAFSDMGNYLGEGNNALDVSGLDAELRRVIESVKTYQTGSKEKGMKANIKLYNKIDALMQLAKLLGLPKQQVQENDGLRQIIINPIGPIEEHPDFQKYFPNGLPLTIKEPPISG